MAWMPEPVWQNIAGLGIEYSALYAALSFWFALLLFSRKKLLSGESTEPCADWIPFGIAGAMVGARLGYFAFEIPGEFLSEPGGLLWNPGFSFHGGALGVVAGTCLFASRSGLPVRSTLDELAIAGALAFLFMSLGGLLSNEVVGAASNGAFAIVFPIYDEGNLNPPHRIPVFHLQVAWAAVVLVISLSLERSRWLRSKPSGTLAFVTSSCVFAGLLFLDPLKERRTHVAAASYATTLSVLDAVCLAASLAILVVVSRRQTEAQAS